MPRRGKRGEVLGTLLSAAVFFLTGCPRAGPSGPPPSPPGSAAPSVPRLLVQVVDADDRPVPEGRLAVLAPKAFDPEGRLRPEEVSACPERLRVVVEDPSPAPPTSVSVIAHPDEPPLVLPLLGAGPRRGTAPFLLVGDRDDAAASGSVRFALPGGRLEVRYREKPVAELKVGPAVIQEIPVRVIAAGPDLPDPLEVEKAVDLRLRQANAVWEPFGRRFARGPISRIDTVRGLALIRGRAAGVDSRGRPSHSGLRVDGRDLLVPCAWREDGAPLTPKAVARALVEKAGAAFRVELFDGLAGDRDAVLLQWSRRGGGPAEIEPLAASNDLAQAVTPLAISLSEGLEVAPPGSGRTVDEAGLLALGKKGTSGGIDLFVVAGVRSLLERPAFKVYPEGRVSSMIASSAVVSWPIMDATGRYPYALARVFGELLLPLSLRPGPEDTLFQDPLSATAGVDARKRLSAATGARIAERGRGLAGRK